MQKFKLLIQTTIILVSLLFIFLGCESEKKIIDHKENISKHLRIIEKKPTNCFSAEQIASGYQSQNNYKQAILFYQKALNNCSDNLLSQFQMGVCHYLIMEREIGIGFMDKAIEQAQKTNKTEIVSMFIKEKRSWLERWDMVKEMEWNRIKK